MTDRLKTLGILPTLSEAEMTKFSETNDRRIKDRVITAIENSDDPLLFARKLGISEHDLAELLRQRRVVSFTVDNFRFYPHLQLDRQGTVIPGVQDLVDTLGAGVVNFVNWAQWESDTLGRTRVEALLDGDFEGVRQDAFESNPENRT